MIAGLQHASFLERMQRCKACTRHVRPPTFPPKSSGSVRDRQVIGWNGQVGRCFVGHVLTHTAATASVLFHFMTQGCHLDARFINAFAIRYGQRRQKGMPAEIDVTARQQDTAPRYEREREDTMAKLFRAGKRHYRIL